MKNLRLLDQYRVPQNEMDGRFAFLLGDAFTAEAMSHGGWFRVKSPVDFAEMFIVVSDAGGWDHVSVSRERRCPNWPEMDHVKRLFFEDEETAVQFHVPVAKHINIHPYTLHLWRDQVNGVRLPPEIYV